ncbi:hypothetical protein GGI43DRAFT_421407 [Trichoderma evansii]
MVGVAGRSKACNTCKIRHVRCDARHPSCQRCEAGAFTCLGYQRPTVFIDQTNHIREMVMKLQYNCHLLASIYHFPFRSLVSMYDKVRVFMDKILMSQDPKLSCGLKHEDPVDPAVTPMLGTSIESVALYMYGKHTQNIAKVHQAFKLHGKILDRLRAVISHHYDTNHQSKRVSAQLLVVIMNMVIYEVYCASFDNSYNRKRLERSCTWSGSSDQQLRPCCVPSGVYETIAEYMLTYELKVVAHLDDVQHMFLEQSSWQEVPWHHQPEPKSIINYYIDILCCIPGLLEDKNLLLDGLAVDPNALRHSIACQIFRLYTKLLQVRWFWEVSNPSCCHEVLTDKESPAALLPTEKASGQPLFEPLLVFSSFQRAIETNLYKCCMLFLCDMAAQLGTLNELKQLPISQLFDSAYSVSNFDGLGGKVTKCAKIAGHYTGVTQTPYAHKTNPALAFPNELSTWNLAAYEICRSIKYMLRPNHGPAGAYFAIFPLRVAQIFIEAWSKAESGPKLRPFLRGKYITVKPIPGTPLTPN